MLAVHIICWVRPGSPNSLWFLSLCLLKLMCMCKYILLWSVHINNLWVDIVYVIVCMCALLCVFLYYDVIMHQHWRLFHMCVLVAAQWNPPGDHQCVSVWENNKYEEGGEMRGCDHQSIPLLLLKLRGRDRERERQRESRIEVGGTTEHFSVEEL